MKITIKSLGVIIAKGIDVHEKLVGRFIESPKLEE